MTGSWTTLVTFLVWMSFGVSRTRSSRSLWYALVLNPILLLILLFDQYMGTDIAGLGSGWLEQSLLLVMLESAVKNGHPFADALCVLFRDETARTPYIAECLEDLRRSIFRKSVLLPAYACAFHFVCC